MRIDSLTSVPPKLERPVATGAATSVKVEVNVHLSEPVKPVSQAVELGGARAEPSEERSETVWLDSDRRPVYRVIDTVSGDVVSQIPSDEVLRVCRNIDEMLDDQKTSSVNVES